MKKLKIVVLTVCLATLVLALTACSNVALMARLSPAREDIDYTAATQLAVPENVVFKGTVCDYAFVYENEENNRALVSASGTMLTGYDYVSFSALTDAENAPLVLAGKSFAAPTPEDANATTVQYGVLSAKTGAVLLACDYQANEIEVMGNCLRVKNGLYKITADGLVLFRAEDATPLLFQNITLADNYYLIQTDDYYYLYEKEGNVVQHFSAEYDIYMLSDERLFMQRVLPADVAEKKNYSYIDEDGSKMFIEQQYYVTRQTKYAETDIVFYVEDIFNKYTNPDYFSLLDSKVQDYNVLIGYQTMSKRMQPGVKRLVMSKTMRQQELTDVLGTKNFGEDRYVAQTEASSYIVDAAGNKVGDIGAGCYAADAYNGLLSVFSETAGTYGVLNSNGKVVLPFAYTAVYLGTRVIVVEDDNYYTANVTDGSLTALADVYSVAPEGIDGLYVTKADDNYTVRNYAGTSLLETGASVPVFKILAGGQGVLVTYQQTVNDITKTVYYVIK